jgi:hypothetical protein
VKMLKNLGLAMVAFSLLAIPAAARNGQKGVQSNTGTGKQRGQARAEEVQTANNKGDKDHTPSKGSKSKGKKTRTRAREGWEKNAKHNANAKGHSK